MTEVGVIGTDLFGAHRPAIRPAPGITSASRGGELLVRLPGVALPRLSRPDPLVRRLAAHPRRRHRRPGHRPGHRARRLDSQVSVGGLKVDLTEVEPTLAALPGVAAAVVVRDDGITRTS